MERTRYQILYSALACFLCAPLLGISTIAIADNATKTQISASQYPAWNADTEYLGGAMVNYHGVLYKAQWWTKGEKPFTTSSNPSWDSAWLYEGDADAPPPPEHVLPGTPVITLPINSTSGAVTLSWQTSGTAGNYWEVWDGSTKIHAMTAADSKNGTVSLNLSNGTHSLIVKLCVDDSAKQCASSLPARI